MESLKSDSNVLRIKSSIITQQNPIVSLTNKYTVLTLNKSFESFAFFSFNGVYV